MADETHKDAPKDAETPRAAQTPEGAATTRTGSDGGPAAKQPSAIETWIARQAIRHSTLTMMLILVLWALTITLAYFTWIVVLPDLWVWAGGFPFRIVGAVFGTILLLYIPPMAGMVVYKLGGFAAGGIVSPEGQRVQNAQDQLRESEQFAIDRLEATDEAGLLPLLKYSRAQLNQYYTMGLGQTKRSFFHALIAMWLGFIILILGLALYVGPVEKLGLQRPSQDFTILILSTAAIIEFISVLFLWIYRSTMGQLTFYYRLQMRNHNSILCFRMTTGMGGGKDEATRAIIDSMLLSSFEPERAAVQGSGGLRAWFGPPSVRAADAATS